ncbi:hypothetical protein ZYGR_0A00330 [Zygosaccharomyces rouxii]|uniref:ZYRO0A00704p n=2 Tax=Zygosaccharomyces rouxii TaxID=4956 RepID=C5DP61_ZYGRC|nr:uncharacterized protein ZYRO0A00704g [Zygosaccharomyces rouxii]KAH9199009.1 hypothetical protein LQ764DRAFT_235924 [Zygosaccharomyces rouxii]GAV46442.1 hypothetical protein ZYGR_0A00330 [Zygosaccharomyces rouxii]CAR25472.1 ZYRO0A00704p [Zygosaccharomyces rouxii]
MKPSISILYSLAVSANVANVIADGSIFDSWTHSDLKSYIKDQQRSLEKLSSKTYEELKETLSEAWPGQTGSKKPWWQFWPSQSSVTGSSQPVTDWLFETWPMERLHAFLKKNGIHPHPGATKDQLIKYIKDHFYSISEKLDTSGFYPSSSYFEHWTADDFKSWLQDFEVPFEENNDELLDKVRENIYHVSKAAEEKRLNALKSLDLANRELLDSAGDIKKDVFEHWSAEDLRKWLNSHKIPYNDDIEEKRDALAALASDQKELLKDDIQWFLEAAQRHSSPFLSKSPDYVCSVWDKTLLNLGSAFNSVQNKVGDVINDTFLIDLDSWPRGKITEFLDARGVSYSKIATNEQLRALVREVRNKPLKKAQEKYDQLTDGAWYHSLKNWAQRKSGEVQGNDYYKSVSTNAKTLSKNTQSWASGLGKKVKDDFNSWSVEDLKNYLKKMSGGASTATMSKDELVKLVREKTNLMLGVQEQPWYERWTNNVKNLFSRVPAALAVRQ